MPVYYRIHFLPAFSFLKHLLPHFLLFFPPYHHSKATVIHMLLTIIPLWTAVYFGLIRICRKQKLKKREGDK